MGTYLLGIDVGTTGAKTLLVNEAGEVAASATHEYPMFTPKPLWVEQDPEDWWQATASGIKDVLAQSSVSAEEVAGVGLTGQMHGLVLLDEQGEVLRRCIMWNDQRTGPQCDAITREVGEEELIALTGNPVLPGFTAPKIKWVEEHEPEVYERVSKVLLPKDYVRYRLTGAVFSEVSDASGTSMFDVAERTWSEDMLQVLKVPREWLPEVTESPVVSAEVGAAAASETGLARGTPVVGGAGDQAAQAVGTGIIREELASVTLGTSGVVFAPSEHYRVEPEGKLHAFCHAVPGMWHLMGVMLSAGGSLRWYRDALGQVERETEADGGVEAYEQLTEAAASVPAGCEGLIFLPYLSGERSPHADPDARGVFFGLTLRHGKPHMTRAVLEGVAFGLCDSVNLMRGLGLSLDEVRVSGGGARSPLWRQILADVVGVEMTTVNVTQGAVFGAALLAGVGLGVFEDLDEACAQAVQITGRVEPGPSTGRYEEMYEVYRALYPALAPQFKALSQI
jgi:xylulokinase